MSGHITERTRSYCAGASVLIYTRSRTGQISLLLGQDSTGEHKWSDFGGGATKRESSWACAARELAEETHGMFSSKITPDYLKLQPRATFKFPSKRKKNKALHYATFLVRVSERFQPAEFLERAKKLSAKERRLVCRTEKQKLQFVPLSQIDCLPLRSFFKQRLRHIVPKLNDCVFNVPSFIVVLGQRRVTPPKESPFRQRKKAMTVDQQAIVDSMLSTYTPPVPV
jgi:ADP-ribose pyrophosphatase YjhB (NUDIX family)